MKKENIIQILLAACMHTTCCAQAGIWEKIQELIFKKSNNTTTTPRTFTLENKIRPETDTTTNNIQDTSLHDAVKEGNLSKVTSLLNNNADIYAQDKEGNTPLHYLFTNYSIKQQNTTFTICKTLLDHEEKLNKDNMFGTQSIATITNNQKKNIIDILIEKHQEERFTGNPNNSKPIQKISAYLFRHLISQKRNYITFNTPDNFDKLKNQLNIFSKEDRPKKSPQRSPQKKQ